MQQTRSQIRKGTVEDVPFQIKDIIKFELSDARIPNKENPKQLKAIDMDTMGSHIVQVQHPPPTQDPRGRQLRELPIGVQKVISHAFRQNYNLPYLDTVKYYFKEQNGAKPLYTYDVGESNKAIVASTTTKLKPESASKPWWQSLKGTNAQPVVSYSVLSTQEPVSTTHRPYSVLKTYPVRYTYKLAPTTTRVISYYGDKLQPKTPYIYSKPLKPISIADSPSAFESLPEVTTTNSITSTAPVLFPVTQSPFPKNQNPLASLLKFYSSEQDIQNYFQSKDTLTLIKAAVDALKEQNPHLEVVPKGIENNELIVRVTPKPDYLASTEAPKPVTEDGTILEPNLTYLTKSSSVVSDIDVVRIVPSTVKTIEHNPRSHAFVNNLHNPDTHSEVSAFLLFTYYCYLSLDS